MKEKCDPNFFTMAITEKNIKFFFFLCLLVVSMIFIVSPTYSQNGYPSYDDIYQSHDDIYPSYDRSPVSQAWDYRDGDVEASAYPNVAVFTFSLSSDDISKFDNDRDINIGQDNDYKLDWGVCVPEGSDKINYQTYFYLTTSPPIIFKKYSNVNIWICQEHNMIELGINPITMNLGSEEINLLNEYKSFYLVVYYDGDKQDLKINYLKIYKSSTQ